MRRRATSGVMSFAHFLLVVTAVVFLLGSYSWGQVALRWAYNRTLAAHVSGWYSNTLIHTAMTWAHSLPWGATDLFYPGLAVVCMLAYFLRWTGWVALPVAIVGAVYGVPAAVSTIPFFILDWPVTVGAAFIAWIAIHNARERARGARLPR